MKQSAFLSIIMGLSFIFASKVVKSVAASQEEVKWNFVAVQTGDNFFEIHLKATIHQPWRIYSQYADADQIPERTRIKFTPNPVVKFIDKPAEQGNLVITIDNELGGIQRYYEDNVIFIQPVKLKDTKTPIAVKGTVHYQVCSQEECKQPATKEFVVVLRVEKTKQ